MGRTSTSAPIRAKRARSPDLVVAPNDRMRLRLLPAFNDAQENADNHELLFKKIKKLYAEAKKDEHVKHFWGVFWDLLLRVLVVWEESPYVDRILKFAAKCTIEMGYPDNETMKEIEAANFEQRPNDLTPGFKSLLGHVTRLMATKDRAVRLRSCELLGYMLGEMMAERADGVEFELGKRKQIVEDSLVRRIKDKQVRVRVAAVHALQHVQNTIAHEQTGKEVANKALDTLIYVCKADPSPEVRMTALLSLSPHALTREVMVGRCRDSSDKVRKVAYKVIVEKYSAKSIRWAQRITLITDGLTDTSPTVRSYVATRMIPEWQAFLLNNDKSKKGDERKSILGKGAEPEPASTLSEATTSVIKLISHLDPTVPNALSQKAVEMVLRAIIIGRMRKTSLRRVVDDFDLLTQHRTMMAEHLSCEAMLYWRMLVVVVHEEGKDEAEKEHCFGKLLPALNLLCDYVETHMTINVLSAQTAADATDKARIKTRLRANFTAIQLMHLLQLTVDNAVNDKHGNDRYGRLLEETLLCNVNLPTALLEPCIRQYIQMATHKMGGEIDDVIVNRSQSGGFGDVVFDETAPLTIEQKVANHVIGYIVGIISEHLHEEQERLEPPKEEGEEETINEEDLMEENDERKARLERERLDLLKRMDLRVLLNSLSMTAVLLKMSIITKLDNRLHEIFNQLVYPLYQHTNVNVRQLCFRCIGLYSIVSWSVAHDAFVLFRPACYVENEAVKEVVVEAVMDIALIHGVDRVAKVWAQLDEASQQADATHIGNATQHHINLKAEDGEEEGDTRVQKWLQKMHRLIVPEALIVHKVAEGVTEGGKVAAVTVEGLLKLLLHNHIACPTTVAKLLLAWFTPESEHNHKLRDCLSIFWTLYAGSHPSHCMTLAHAVGPLLHLLGGEANTALYRGSVDSFKAASLLINLTMAGNSKEALPTYDEEEEEDMDATDNRDKKADRRVLVDDYLPHVAIGKHLLTTLAAFDLDKQDDVNAIKVMSRLLHALVWPDIVAYKEKGDNRYLRVLNEVRPLPALVTEALDFVGDKPSRKYLTVVGDRLKMAMSGCGVDEGDEEEGDAEGTPDLDDVEDTSDSRSKRETKTEEEEENKTESSSGGRNTRGAKKARTASEALADKIVSIDIKEEEDDLPTEAKRPKLTRLASSRKGSAEDVTESSPKRSRRVLSRRNKDIE